MSSKKIHKKFSDTYNVPICYTKTPQKHCNWDGKNINVKGMPEQNILHEIAHWILAPKKYHKYVDFALGVGPDSDYDIYQESKGLKRPARSNSDLEESVTCTLEFIFGAMTEDLYDMVKTMQDRNFGGFAKHKTPRRKKISAKDFAWSSAPSLAQEMQESFQENINILIKKKIIDKNWLPVLLKKNNLITKTNQENLTKFREMLNL